MAEGWNVVLTVDTDGAVKELREFDMQAKKSGASMKKMDTQADKATASMTRMGGAASRLKSALSLIGFTGVSAAMLIATKQARDFDKAMAEVSTLIDESYDPTNRLAGEVRRLSVEYAQSPTTQAKALYQVISAGAKDASQAVQTLTSANKLAVGGVTDVATAADGLTSVMNAYGLEADAASRISDVMFEAMKAGKTTIGELSGAVGLLAPIAAATGVSIEEMFAATAALTKGGLSTSMAMTGLRQALVNILKPMSTSASQAAELGVQFNATAIKTLGLAGFMDQLIDKAEGNTDALVNLFGSVEGLNAMMALTSKAGAEDFAAILDQMNGGLERLIRDSGAAKDEGIAPLKGAMEALITPTEQALRAAAGLGLSFGSATKSTEGLAQFMKMLTEKVGDNEKELAKLFGSMENYNALMKQVGRDGGEAMIGMFREMKTGLSATDEAVKKVTDSIDFQISQLGARVKDEFLGMGQSMLTALGPVVSFMNENFATILRVLATSVAALAAVLAGKFIASIALAEGGLIVLTAGLVKSTAAMGATASASMALSLGLTALALKVKALTLALLANPITWIAAIAAMTVWIATGKNAEEQATDLIAEIDELTMKFHDLSEAAQLEAIEITTSGVRELQDELDDLIAKRDDIEHRGLGGGITADMEPAKEEIVRLNAAIEAMSAKTTTAAESLFQMRDSQYEAVAAAAAQRIATLGLVDDYDKWVQAREAAAAAATSEQIEEHRANLERMESVGIIQGLTKEQQRRFDQLKAIANPMKAINEKEAKDIQIIGLAYALKTKNFEEGSEKMRKALAEEQKEIANINAYYDEQRAKLDEVGIAKQKYVDKLKQLQDKYSGLSSAASTFERELAELNKLAQEGAIDAKELADETERLKELYESNMRKKALKELELLRAGTDKYKRALVEQKHELEEVQKAEWFLALTHDKDRAEALDLIRAKHEEYNETLRETCEKTDKFKECQDENSKAIEAIWEQAWKNIQGIFADAFRGAFDSFSDFKDALIDSFKDMIAQMAAAWFSSKIADWFGFGGTGGGGGGFIQALGSIFGGGGGGGGPSSGQLGTVVEAFGGNIGGIGGSQPGFEGGGAGGTLTNSESNQVGNQIGNAIAGSAAFKALAASAVAFGQGMYAFFGGTSVGGVSLAELGIANTGMGGIGASSASIWSTTGSVSATAGAVVGGAGIGALVGMPVNAIFGDRGDPTRNAIFSAIGGAIGSIWGPPGSAIGGAIGSFVDNLIGGAKKLESATLELDAQGVRFLAATETVVSKQRSFFRGRKFKTTRENLTSEFGELQEALKGFKEALETIAESFGADIGTVIDDFRLSRDLNIKGKSTDQIAKMVEGFVEDVQRGIINDYVDALEGQVDDHIMTTLRHFSGQTVHTLRGWGRDFERRMFEEIDFMERTYRSYNFSVEEFIRAAGALSVMESLFNLDLVEEVSTAIEEANRTAFESYERMLVAYREVVAEYDGSVEALENIAVATSMVVETQMQLIAVYKDIQSQINLMFGTTRQTIMEALMSEEELYDLRQSQVDDLVSQLNEAADPTQIANLTQAINALTLDAFNMLDETQQQTMGQDFLTFLDEVMALANERIEMGISQLEADQAALDMEVATELMNQAAETQAEAAETFREAVEDWRDMMNNYGGGSYVGPNYRREVLP